MEEGETVHEVAEVLRPYLPLIAEAAAEAERRTRRRFFPYLLGIAAVALLIGFLAGMQFAASRAVPTPPLLPDVRQGGQPPAARTPFPTVTPEPLVVYVGGAVRNPHRVYTLPAGSLVADAIEAAGGPAENADLDALNLAQPLVMHQHIVVPTLPPTAEAAQGMPSPPATGKIDINTATAEELQQLPGIGPTRAHDIVSYRETHGPFPSIEALQQVPGIGPATYEKLAPYITAGNP